MLSLDRYKENVQNIMKLHLIWNPLFHKDVVEFSLKCFFFFQEIRNFLKLPIYH